MLGSKTKFHYKLQMGYIQSKIEREYIGERQKKRAIQRMVHINYK